MTRSHVTQIITTAARNASLHLSQFGLGNRLCVLVTTLPAIKYGLRLFKFYFSISGIAQLVKSTLICYTSSNNHFKNCANYNGEAVLRCDPHHAVLIRNFTVGYYNEDEEQTCCQRRPENICTVDPNDVEKSLISVYSQLGQCKVNQTCSLPNIGWGIDFIVDHSSCSSQTLMSNFEYECVSDTSIESITKLWRNQNLKSVSLFHNGERRPFSNGHYYCSSQIEADDNDVYIYTWVSFLQFSSGYNTKLTIYSRDYTVTYKANRTIERSFKLVVYKQIKQTKGPIYLIYETYGTSHDETYAPRYNQAHFWINFKASRGRLNVNSTGCQLGFSVPPIFKIPPSPRYVQTSSSVPPTSSPGNDQNTSSYNIWTYGLIGGLVVVSVFGLAIVKIGFPN
ncbi:hypothetical protein SNE40_020665 [Patella caerulea]|uniref:Uncharacterized protein n=1 Tax=Patella caerulea TaxID=87958 RepID=A0AAN8P7J7_PATCE